MLAQCGCSSGTNTHNRVVLVLQLEKTLCEGHTAGLHTTLTFCSTPLPTSHLRLQVMHRFLAQLDNPNVPSIGGRHKDDWILWCCKEQVIGYMQSATLLRKAIRLT